MEFFTAIAQIQRKQCPPKRWDAEGSEYGMEEKIRLQEGRNPWEDREKIPAPTPFLTALSLLALAVSSLQMVQPFGEWVSLLLTGLLFAYVVLVARTPGLVTPLLLTAAIPVLFGMSFSVSAFLLSVAAGTASIAFLCTAPRRGYLGLLIPAAVFAGTWILSGELWLALGALGLIPGGVLLAVATRRGASRTSAITMAGAGMALSVAIPVLILLIIDSRALGIDVPAYVRHLQDLLADQMIALRDEWFALMTAEPELQTPELTEQLEQMKKLLTDDLLRNMVLPTVVALLPGLLLGGSAILGFEAQLLLTASYRRAGLASVITKDSVMLTMSLPSAILYILALMLVMFASANGILWAVAANLFLMLLPGFLLVGARSLLVLFAKAQNGRIFLLIAVAALFCCNFLGGFLVLSLWGATGTAMLPLREKLLKSMNSDGGPEA